MNGNAPATEESIWAPDYYPLFHCTAGSCRHTCCAGWEIDIDEESLRRWDQKEDPFAERVRACIAREAVPHFALLPGERCPLLREDGLCDMILCWGAEELCQICADHPRFRNFWTGRTELGLGLVCEEAARLILTREAPMRLIRLSGSGRERLPREERELMALRKELFARLSASAPDAPSARLAEYLVYRHFADALYDSRTEERIAFIRDAFDAIQSARRDGSVEELTGLCRVFSDRVEYDDEILADLTVPADLFG